MKKPIHYFLFIILIMASAACGNDSEKPNVMKEEKNAKKEEIIDEKKPAQLVIWEEKGKASALKPAIQAFEKEYGIKVSYEEKEITEEMHERLLREGPIGKAPDVVTFSSAEIGQLVKEGLIQEIQTEEKTTDRFFESALKSQMYQGKLFGLPKSAVTSVLVYNKKQMNPEVAGKLENVFEKAKDQNGKSPYLLGASWNRFYDAYGVMGGMGVYIFKEKAGKLDERNIGLNNEEAIKAADYMKKWYKAGLLPKEDQLEDRFIKGSLSSIVTSNPAMLHGKNIGVGVLPQLPEGKEWTPFMEVKGWHVTAFTKHPRWSAKLTEYLVREEHALQRYETTGEIPPHQSIISHDGLDRWGKAQAKQLQNTEPIPNIPEMERVKKSMDQALEKIMNGELQPEKALDEAVKAIRQE